MNRNIVITGSTSGIGKALVDLLSIDNYIFAGYRNSAKVKDIVNVDYFYIDMTDRKSISDAADYIKSKTDKVDILINVAGCVAAGPVENLDTDRLREQFEVNTFSHIEFTQKLVPVLENGRVINISSMASFGNFPFISPYCASKRALDIFFNAFSIENHKNIKVISIKPGVIATPIWEKSVEANLRDLENCVVYKRELEFLKANALKNTNKGLDVCKTAKIIKDIAFSKNPKISYTIGRDARFAQILSMFPQDVVNRLVKFALEHRINKYCKEM